MRELLEGMLGHSKLLLEMFGVTGQKLIQLHLTRQDRGSHRDRLQ